MRIGKETKRVINPKRFVPVPIPVTIPEKESVPERELVPVERPLREEEINAG